MFQLEPILWLQGFASPPLTLFLLLVTNLGYTLVYVTLLVVLAFWMRPRAMLSVLLAVLLAALATEGLKNAAALPRPGDIRPELQQPGRVSAETLPVGAGWGFWNLPSASAPAAPAGAKPNYGFPSGHVSAATAFGLGLLLFFGGRRLLAFAIAWPALMALSRMYLGRHFLGDVLGGLGVGVAAACAVWLWRRWLGGDRRTLPARLAITLAVTLGLAALSVTTLLLEPQTVGRFGGVVGAYLTLTVVGFPADTGTGARRAARVACGGLAYLVMMALADGVPESARLAALLASALALGGALIAGMAVAHRMGWSVAEITR